MRLPFLSPTVFRRTALATLLLLFLPPFGFAFPLILLFAPPVGLFLLLVPAFSYYRARKHPAAALAPWQTLAFCALLLILAGILYVDISTLAQGTFLPKVSM